MLIKIFSMTLCMMLFANFVYSQTKPSSPVYELRVYTPEEGRQADVLKLIESSGMSYMAKHNIKFLAAWTPVDSNDTRVFTLVSHKDKASGEAAWNAFQNDAGWKDSLQKSVVNGKKPVKSFEQIFLVENDYSPAFNLTQSSNRIFELRTYVASPGNLAALNNRFRNHTLKLFEKHGMTNVVYWSVLEGEKLSCEKLLEAGAPAGSPKNAQDASMPAAGNSLVYFVAHATRDAATNSWSGFRGDDNWKKALGDSEAAAGGPLTAKNGVKSLFLKPVSFSPLK